MASALPAIAPGSIISIYGSNLGLGNAAAAASPPTFLNGTTVTVNNIPIPLLQTNHALAQNYPDYSLNSSSNPAQPGQYITVYLTGQGLLDNPVPTGAPAPCSPLSRPQAPVVAKIGGQAATVYFAGMVPGFVGLLQMNVLVPVVPAGDQPFEVSIGGVAANPTVISVGTN